MTRGSTQDRWRDQPEDDYPDFLWPDDDDGQDGGRPDDAGQPGGPGTGVPDGRPVPVPWPVPPVPYQPPDARGRWRAALALAVTAVVAVGLGAGAVLVYRHAEAGSAPAAAASRSASFAPGQGGGPAGPGSVSEAEVLGTVTAIGNSSITIGGGPVQSIRAAVTSATRFTGTARNLTAVRVGDVVEAQIRVAGGSAKVISLQDPASQS